MDETPVEATQKYIHGVEWPASKEAVITALERTGASDDIVQALRSADKERFVGPNDVHNVLWKAA